MINFSYCFNVNLSFFAISGDRHVESVRLYVRFAGKEQPGKCCAEFLFDVPAKWSSAVDDIRLFDRSRFDVVGDVNVHVVFTADPGGEFFELDVENLLHVFSAQGVEEDDVVESVEKFWGHFTFQKVKSLTFSGLEVSIFSCFEKQLRANITCKYDDGVGEVDFCSFTVGQAAFV